MFTPHGFGSFDGAASSAFPRGDAQRVASARAEPSRLRGVRTAEGLGMASRKLDKSEWRAFCDRMSKGLIGKQAEIEIASLALGSHVQSEWLPLLGIVYDPKSDVIEIALDGLDHMIPRPRELYVDIGPGGMANLEIVDSGGVRQIVTLREPVKPPPGSATARLDCRCLDLPQRSPTLLTRRAGQDRREASHAGRARWSPDIFAAQ